MVQKHSWKFGRTRNSVETLAFVFPLQFPVLQNVHSCFYKVYGSAKNVFYFSNILKYTGCQYIPKIITYLWIKIECIYISCTNSFYILAQIWNPLGNITYWLAGSTVALSWTIIYRKEDIVFSTLSFTKFGSDRPTILARSRFGANFRSLNSSYNVDGQAKLAFENARLGHNGTYSLDLMLQDGDGFMKVTSNIAVIILGKFKV